MSCFIDAFDKPPPIGSKRFQQFQKLYDVEAPLTAFNLGDIRLRLTKVIRDVLLCQTCCHTGIPQFVKQTFMCWRSERLGHKRLASEETLAWLSPE